MKPESTEPKRMTREEFRASIRAVDLEPSPTAKFAADLSDEKCKEILAAGGLDAYIDGPLRQRILLTRFELDGIGKKLAAMSVNPTKSI